MKWLLPLVLLVGCNGIPTDHARLYADSVGQEGINAILASDAYSDELKAEYQLTHDLFLESLDAAD